MTAPADHEPENYETDGSKDAEIASLRAQLQESDERNRKAHATLMTARTMVENMSLKFGQFQGIDADLRKVRMVLNGGNAITQTAKGEALIEEWLQDPHRNIFGLAADLLDVIAPAKQ